MATHPADRHDASMSAALAARKRKFLDAMNNGATVQEAANLAGCEAGTPWRWAVQDEEFGVEFELHLGARSDALVDKALDLAVSMIEERGDPRLMITLIQRRDREREALRMRRQSSSDQDDLQVAGRSREEVIEDWHQRMRKAIGAG